MHIRERSHGSEGKCKLTAACMSSATRAISALSHTHTQSHIRHGMFTSTYSIDPHTRCCAFCLLYTYIIPGINTPASGVRCGGEPGSDLALFGMPVIPNPWTTRCWGCIAVPCVSFFPPAFFSQAWQTRYNACFGTMHSTCVCVYVCVRRGWGRRSIIVTSINDLSPSVSRCYDRGGGLTGACSLPSALCSLI
jgi:hypothetical protein